MKQIFLVLFLVAVCIQLTISQPGNSAQTFYTGGGCSEIPNLGSPILMIANAQNYIEDALDTHNSYTQINYVFHESVVSVNKPGSKNTKLVFEINSYAGKKYLAVELEVITGGIGSTRIKKFMMSKELKKIGFAFEIPSIETAVNSGFNCGDLKFIYSSHGNKESNKLEYLFPGRNQNQGSGPLLSNLSAQSSTSSKSKVCVTKNYNETFDFYGSLTTTTAQDLTNCLPDQPGIAGISINCDNGAGRIRYIRMTYNNIGGAGVSYSNLIGNSSATMADTVEIDLKAADKIQIISYFLPGSNKAIHINTLDENNQVLSVYNCGSFTGGTKEEIIVEVSNFLGFSKVQTNVAVTRVERLEVMTYREY